MSNDKPVLEDTTSTSVHSHLEAKHGSVPGDIKRGEGFHSLIAWHWLQHTDTPDELDHTHTSFAEPDPHETNFEEFVDRQFPLKPSDHPDFARLREVVKQVEDWKARGVDAKEAYAAELMDTYSVVYLATQRSGMNVELFEDQPLANDMAGAKKQLVEFVTNSWVEGFLFGMLFQQLGGHRDETKGGNDGGSNA